jgi:GTP-binding protein
MGMRPLRMPRPLIGTRVPQSPTIAIVGRPNVGKSTLFNRLTGTRDALVSDLPGLTRDRRSGAVEIAGHRMTVVDTAGLEEAARGSIADRMRRQSETAIRKADLVLFVIDARAGVTPADTAFADIVRRAGRPAILVANKCEGRAGESSLYEAFALGLGAPVAISAEHGQGLGDLEDDMLAALGLKAIARRKELPAGDDVAEAPASARRPIRVAIVGRPNVGKSTLVNAVLGEERMITGPEPGLTRDAVASDLDWKGHAFRVWDTAGLRRKAKVVERAEKLSNTDAVRAIRFADVVVLLIDAGRPFEHQDLTIADLVTTEGRAIVVAINKWDAVAEKQKLLKDIRETVKEKLSDVQGVRVVTLSALAESGIDALMQAVVEAYGVWNRRIATPELNRWLGEALERHAPPAARGRRIRIRFMTQPSTRPPTFVGFCSLPAALPPAYHRYLVNSLRAAFDLPGTPIRLNLRKGANPFADR